MSKDRRLLLELISSLTLADHMGDASSDCYEALSRLGMKDIPDWDDLRRWLAKEHGVGSLWTSNESMLRDYERDEQEGLT